MVYVMLGTGFEEIEALAPVDLMRRAGIEVLTVGINGKIVSGGRGIGVQADITMDEMDLTDLEMIVLPGGLGGVASIRACQKAMDAISFEEREAPAYNEAAVLAAKKEKEKAIPHFLYNTIFTNVPSLESTSTRLKCPFSLIYSLIT